LATGGSEEVTVWSFKGNGPEGTSPLSLKLHKKPITTLAFAHRGMNLASGSRDGAVVLWDLKSENEESGLSETSVSDSVSKLYWRPDDKALAGLDRQGGVTVWHV
jgi:WD40 repeat protein